MDHVGPIAQPDVAVVTHDGKRQDFAAKLPGQELQKLLNPGFAMVKVLARDRILAAQEGPPDCALDAVLNADFRFLNQVASRQSGHGRFSTRVLGEVAPVPHKTSYGWPLLPGTSLSQHHEDTGLLAAPLFGLKDLVDGGN